MKCDNIKKLSTFDRRMSPTDRKSPHLATLSNKIDQEVHTSPSDDRQEQTLPKDVDIPTGQQEDGIHT